MSSVETQLYCLIRSFGPQSSSSLMSFNKSRRYHITLIYICNSTRRFVVSGYEILSTFIHKILILSQLNILQAIVKTAQDSARYKTQTI